MFSVGPRANVTLACFAALSALALAGTARLLPAPGKTPPLQTTAPPPQAELKVHADLVKVDVSITDKHGKFVAGLKKGNFRVFDDNVEQPVTFFASTEAPAEILVLVETSPAVFFVHRQHLDGAYALLSGLRPDDQVALATYAQGTNLILPFTADKTALAQALATLEYTLGSGQLNFYDAVSASLDWLSKIPAKKALVILSTGLDSSPPGHWEALEQKLRGSEVTIFPVALGGSFRSYRGGPSQASRDDGFNPASLPGLSFAASSRALDSLARLSGGQAFFPKKDKDFVGIYQHIAEILRHEYTLGFKPQARDGKFHSLRIEIFDAQGRPLLSEGPHKGYHVFARQGYEAPGPKE